MFRSATHRILEDEAAAGRLRAELLGLRVDASLLRVLLLHRKYDPGQPRIPAGQSGGGRWTDGGGTGDGERIRVAQNGPPRPARSTTTTRLGARPLEGTPGQISEWAATRMQADAAVAAVRRIDRDWRPDYPSSLTETIEGETAAERARLESAEARLAELADPDVRGEVLHACVMENGELIGRQFRNANDVTTRTVDRETFWELGSRLIAGAERIDRLPNYDGLRYLRWDGSVFGLRYSRKYDLTIDILGGDELLVVRGTKFHFRRDR